MKVCIYLGNQHKNNLAIRFFTGNMFLTYSISALVAITVQQLLVATVSERSSLLKLFFIYIILKEHNTASYF